MRIVAVPPLPSLPSSPRSVLLFALRVSPQALAVFVTMASGCASVRLDPAATDIYHQPWYVQASPSEVADAIRTAIRSGAPEPESAPGTGPGSGGAVRLEAEATRTDNNRWRLRRSDGETLTITHVRGVLRPRDEVTVRLYAIDTTTTEVMAFSRGRWGLFGRRRQWRTLHDWMSLITRRMAADGLKARPAAP